MIIDQPKQRVRITTSDPTTRTIEGRLRDGGVVQIASWEVGPSFRWPMPDEIWSVKRENNFWILKDQIHSAYETFPVDDLSPGELRLDSEDIRDAAGRSVVAYDEDSLEEGDFLVRDTVGWTVMNIGDLNTGGGGTTDKYVESIGAVTANLPITITHGLGTRAVVVSVYENSTYADVECDIVRTGVNTVQLTFAASKIANTYSVVIIG